MIQRILSWFRRRNFSGFLLLEALIGSAIFIMFATMTILVLLAGREASLQSGDQVRGAYISDSALEGARNIRGQGFSKLVFDSFVFGAPYSIALSGSTNLWAYTGSAVSYAGNFKNTVTLTSLAADWVRVAAKTEWKHGYSRSGSVVLYEELTDWTTPLNIGDWSAVTLEGKYDYDPPPNTTPYYNDVAIKGNVAYLSASDNNAGKDISVIDITDVTDTSLIRKLNLHEHVGDLAIKGNVLYALVNDDNEEVQAFDITDPTDPDPLTSYDLPGNGLGLSLAIANDTLLVGSTTHLFGFDISVPSAIILGDVIDMAGNVNRIRTQGSIALLATSNAASELVIIEVEAYDSLLWSGGYDLDEPAPAATAVAVSGTSALIGTLSGSLIQEVSLLTLPGFSPGPWPFEASRKVTGVDIDPTGCYGFVASEFVSKELRILRLLHPPQLAATYATTAAMGAPRNVRYDPLRDRLFVVTNKSLLILKPGSSSSPCHP